ncbi:MAG TPA: hypothetical protein VFH36_01170 [Acidimicrobiales bacterium]|nr:hypothetical protein [Acidimicrobiales bacterium]
MVPRAGTNSVTVSSRGRARDVCRDATVSSEAVGIPAVKRLPLGEVRGTVDYAAKTALACTVTATQTAAHMIAALDAAEILLGCPLIESG